ncbi:MAG TPA: hypothetical protein VLW85_17905, partial [Myxococcales bacterium]|nr:hypothetical protein [Myxococcales bacterium]
LPKYAPSAPREQEDFTALLDTFADEHKAAHDKAQKLIDAVVAQFGERFDGKQVRSYLPSADQIPNATGANDVNPDFYIPDLKERVH